MSIQKHLDKLLTDLFNTCASLLDSYHAGNKQKMLQQVKEMEKTLTMLKKTLENPFVKIGKKDIKAPTYNGCPKCQW